MRALMIAVLSIAAAGVAHAEDRYVSPDGSNRAAGTRDAPWRTLQHAADNIGAGDTVHVAPGRYVGFELTHSGHADAFIRFVADDGAIIDTDNNRTSDGINLEGASFVEINGFTVTGAGRAGIRAVQCQHVHVRNNHVMGSRKWNIFTGFCDDLIIEGNEAARAVNQHGIYVSNSGDRPIIRRNLVHDNKGSGIHMNGDASMGGDGIISEAVVEANLIYGNGDAGGSAINCDGVVDSVFRNNLAYDNHASGISLFGQDGAVGSRRNLVVNNTVVIADDGRYALNIQSGAVENVVRNNVLYSARPVRGAIDISKDSLPGFDSDYNLVVDRFTTTGDDITLTFAQWQAETGQDTHSRVATPAEIFADVVTYRELKADGPAIDAGEAARAPKTDVFGNARPAGAGVDIGAIEHGAVAGGGGDGGAVEPSDPVAPGRVKPGTEVGIPTESDPVAPGPARTARGCCDGGGGEASSLLMCLVILALGRRRLPS